MPCFRPLIGWRGASLNKSGKRPIVFDKSLAYNDLPVSVPCGQCVGCRLERSRQWAVRCMHEASLFDENCFITLTYSDDNLPYNGSLVKRDFQLFMKRLREKYSDKKIRFYYCGEYGEKLGRPHYHALLFNHDFDDKIYFKDCNGHKLYISDALSGLWTFGFSSVGSVTFETAAYVARYVMKKVTGDAAEVHYSGKTPEYTDMSRRPGIGCEWFQKFAGDLKHGKVVVNGVESALPVYYRGLFECYDSSRSLANKRKAVRKGKAFAKVHGGERRSHDREVVMESRLKALKRGLENGE